MASNKNLESQFIVRVDQETRTRIENYLKSTYVGSISELLRRSVMEKVTAWELLQADERRKEEEHQVRLALLKQEHDMRVSRVLKGSYAASVNAS